MADKEFGNLFKMGIDSVAAWNPQKQKSGVDRELGETLGVSPHTIQYWKRGNPPREEYIETIVRYCVKNGRMNEEWVRRFLKHTFYREYEIDALIKDMFKKEEEFEEEKMSAKTKNNLPPKPYGTFVGRSKEINRIREWLEMSTYPLAAIQGMGGIGKTSLALEVAYHCLPENTGWVNRSFDFIVWITAKNLPLFSLELKHVLNAIARQCDYGHIIRAEPHEKEQAVSNLLRKYSIFLIVDNYETVNDDLLFEFLVQIPPPSKALITTRRKHTPKVWDISLDGLSEEESLMLIRQISKQSGLENLVEAKDEELLPLAKVTGNNPKAIENSLGLIRKDVISLEKMVQKLKEVDPKVEKEIFTPIFDLAWDALDKNSRQILFLMPFFVPSADQQALSAISGTRDYDFEVAISKLTEMSLVEVERGLYERDQRYKLHTLTWNFIRHKLGVNPSLDVIDQEQHRKADIPSFDGLKLRFCSYYTGWSRNFLGSTYWDIVWKKVNQTGALSLERLNLIRSLEWARKNKNWEQVLQLARVLIQPLYHQGRVNERIECAEYGLQAAHKLNAREDEMWFDIDGLAFVYLRSGNYELAESYLKAGEKLAKEISQSDGVALVAINRAHIAIQKKQLNQAEQYIDIAFQNAHEVFFLYGANIVAGHIARHRNEYKQAEEFYQKAASYLILDETYLNTTDVWLGFVNIRLAQKVLESIRKMRLDEAIRIFKKYEKESKLESKPMAEYQPYLQELTSLEKIPIPEEVGQIYLQRLEQISAEKFNRLEQEIFEIIQEYDQTGQMNLGLEYQEQLEEFLRRVRQARGYFKKVLRLHSQYGNQRMIAMAKAGLAEVSFTVRDVDEATELIEQASEIFSKMSLQWELEWLVEPMKAEILAINTPLNDRGNPLKRR